MEFIGSTQGLIELTRLLVCELSNFVLYVERYLKLASLLQEDTHAGGLSFMITIQMRQFHYSYNVLANTT